MSESTGQAAPNVTYPLVKQQHRGYEVSKAMGGYLVHCDQRLIGYYLALDGVENANAARVTIYLSANFDHIAKVVKLPSWQRLRQPDEYRMARLLKVRIRCSNAFETAIRRRQRIACT